MVAIPAPARRLGSAAAARGSSALRAGAGRIGQLADATVCDALDALVALSMLTPLRDQVVPQVFRLRRVWSTGPGSRLHGAPPR